MLRFFLFCGISLEDFQGLTVGGRKEKKRDSETDAGKFYEEVQRCKRMK
jgi:hypothetical protein